MEISEQELRAMIRDAIARHSGGGQREVVEVRSEPGMPPGVHSSHGMFLITASTDGDCVIEPAVRCNHCGYCKSLGH
jgi:hypothetical protein